MAIPPVILAPTVAPPPHPVAQRASFAAALAARAAAPAAGAGATAQRPVLAALAHVERAQGRLEAVLTAARAGRTFTAAELLGLQAEAYRCAQTVDLASKLVEQGAQAVRQALNTQLG